MCMLLRPPSIFMSICARVAFLALSLFEILAWHREALVGEWRSFLSNLTAARVVGVVVITTSSSSLAPATALFVLKGRLLVLLLSWKLSHVGHIECSAREGELVEVNSRSTVLAWVEL
jgi:hypothetical protein